MSFGADFTHPIATRKGCGVKENSSLARKRHGKC